MSRTPRQRDRRAYALLARLYRTVTAPPPWRGPIHAPSLRRVLVVRHDRIGDAIVTTPLLAFLHAAAPYAEIDVLVSPANRAIVGADPNVARVIVNDHTWYGWWRALRALRRRKYDLVLSPIFGRGLREGMVAALAGGRRAVRVSVARPKRYAGFFSHMVRTPPWATHMAQRVLVLGQRAIAAPDAIAEGGIERWPLRLVPGDASRERVEGFLSGARIDRFVAVNVSAAEWFRDWPMEQCAATLRDVAARHRDVAFVLTPPPGKVDAAQRVVAKLPGVRAIVYPPSHDLLDLAALLARAAVVVTPDTANIHVASAMRRPVVALYTPLGTPPSLWAPLGVPYRSLVAPGGEPVGAIEPAEIARAIDELLAPRG